MMEDWRVTEAVKALKACIILAIIQLEEELDMATNVVESLRANN